MKDADVATVEVVVVAAETDVDAVADVASAEAMDYSVAVTAVVSG